MDTKQLEYILAIADENNITHASDKLYITQSALNQQLLKLEKELGTPLFHRSKNNWHLTAAGEIYVESAREMMQIKRNAYRKIQDLTAGSSGRLSIGFTAGRGISMFTAAYPHFHRKYPNVEVVPYEANVRTLQKQIAKGNLDIGFLTLTDAEKTDDIYETIATEEFYLGIPNDHPICDTVPVYRDDFGTLDITALRYEPFVLMDKNSTMRTLIDRIFETAAFKPQILFETVNNNTVISMIQAKLCCGIIPYYYVQSKPEGISWYHLPSRPMWSFTASYNKKQYLSEPARYYIDLMKQQWNERMQMV